MLSYFVFQLKNTFYLNYNIISSTPHFPSAPFRLQTPSIRFPFSHPQPYPAALFTLCPTPIQTFPTIGEGSLLLRYEFAFAPLRPASASPTQPPLNRIINNPTANNQQTNIALIANHTPPVTTLPPIIARLLIAPAPFPVHHEPTPCKRHVHPQG